MALIVVLFAVALVSIVVLAYFNLAMMNRSISFSSAGEARANIVALSALDYVKGDLISEMQHGSTLETDPTGSNVMIYYPSTNSTMLPFRMTANLASPDYTLPPNLVKWSSGTIAQWTNTAIYDSTAGPIRGSTCSTTSPSVNGHYLTQSLWTKPAFGTNAAFSTAATPQWVYMSRSGPLTPAVANSGNMAALNNTASTNYVIGRYAYTVYDEGGLLDVAAAGYSPDTFSSDPTDVGRKGSQGFADLTQLGLTPAQADQLVGWRNATSASNTAAYIGYLTTNAPASGFLKAATNDQAFVSRQDLIQFWTGTNPSQMGLNTAAGTNILNYLTTFSREKNAPSWGPEHDANDPNSSTYWNGTNLTMDPVNNTPPATTAQWSYAYKDNANMATNSATSQSVVNRFLPNVRVTTAFNRLSGEPAVVGEPLIKNRFDLNKLAWITHNGIASGISAQDVYNYFGLTLNPDGSGSWIYNHNTVTMPASPSQGKQIMSLDQVAAAGREPDFFELLQAVILQGDMGTISGDPTHANDNTSAGTGGEYYRFYEAASLVGLGSIFPYEAPFCRADTDATTGHLSLVYAQPKYQVIQIGVNAIDQADSDNFPTDVMLNGEHIYGVENLPYICSIGETVLRPAPGTISSLNSGVSSTPPSSDNFNDPDQQYVHQWVTFGLWNPHQNAAYAPTNGPAKIRIAITSGEEYPTVHNLTGYPTAGDYMGRVFEVAGTTIVNHATPNNVDGPAWIGLNLSDYPGHFSEPTMIDPTHAFTSDTDNPTTSNANDGVGIISSSRGWQRAGVYFGWTKSPDNPYKVPLCAGLPGYSGYAANHTGMPAILYDAAGFSMTSPCTIELQYEDPVTPGPTHWHTYQVFRGVVPASSSATGDAYMEPNDPAWASWTAVPANNYNASTNPNGYSNPSGQTITQMVGVNAGPLQSYQEYTVSTLIDPRTGRFNIQNIHAPTTALGCLTNNIGTSTQVLPGADAGAPPWGHFPKSSGGKNNRDFPNTWINNLATDPSFYLDRDFIRRVGDAGGWAGASPLTSGAQLERPYHLDRPFQSVAELGYVFRDDPWKTLNLFSANSGDSGLLDVFYIGSPTTTAQNLPPPDTIAGRMNINSAAQNSISANNSGSLPMQAMLSAGLRDYSLSSPTVANNSIAASDAQTLASSMVAYV
ncbi:MAG TPA: hypothetical protein VHY09_05110, partial [Candidatus Methylacidiphilales bacterium]|nr:hypothetical protein [Candidatus Methylacidiphilales bacterium]